MCKSSCVSIMRRRKERMTKDCEFNRAHPSLPPHSYPSCAQVLLFALLSFFFFLSFLLSFTSSCTALSSCNTKRTKLHHHHHLFFSPLLSFTLKTPFFIFEQSLSSPIPSFLHFASLQLAPLYTSTAHL